MTQPARGRAKDNGPRTRLLIVDDHEVIRQGIRTLLHGSEVEVAGEAATGREAVAAVRELEPDVVLMDIRMPDMDGLVATAEIKQRSPHTSVIILTTFENPEYLHQAVTAGASGYLLKGVSRETLLNAVRLVRTGESTIDSGVLIAACRLALAEPVVVDLPSQLTERERAVLALMAEGLTNKEIAERINYSVGTVKNTVQDIITKLDASDRVQAAVIAARAGLLPG